VCSVPSDVYSYPEDDMVVDPLLADHLAHFGIDIMSMKKVDRTSVFVTDVERYQLMLQSVLAWVFAMCVSQCTGTDQ